MAWGGTDEANEQQEKEIKEKQNIAQGHSSFAGTHAICVMGHTVSLKGIYASQFAQHLTSEHLCSTLLLNTILYVTNIYIYIY